MDMERIKITRLKNNPANPRLIKDDKFYKLVDSLLESPQLLETLPIIADTDKTILSGNMRKKALEHIAKMAESDLRNNLARLHKDDMLDYWLRWQDTREVPYINASELSDADKRKLIIVANSQFGSWDYDMLANKWDEPDLTAWGIDLPTEWENNIEDFSDKNKEIDTESLTDEMELKIRLSSDDYAECVRLLREIDSDLGVALKKLLFKEDAK